MHEHRIISGRKIYKGFVDKNERQSIEVGSMHDYLGHC